MAKSEHYIYASSDSQTLGSFVIELPTTLYLDGSWKCALVECSIKFFSKDMSRIPKEIYILSNFCSTSFFNNLQLPILRKITLAKKVFFSFTPATRLYIPIKQDWMNRLEFSVCDEALDKVEIDEKTVINFTLHLKKY